MQNHKKNENLENINISNMPNNDLKKYSQNNITTNIMTTQSTLINNDNISLNDLDGEISNMPNLNKDLKEMIAKPYTKEFTEEVNKEMCDYLLSLPKDTFTREVYDPNQETDECGEKFNKSSKINYALKILREFKANNYKLTKTHHKNAEMGRRYVSGGGLQSLQNKLKGALVLPGVVDYDIVNCAPTLLLHIMDKYYPKENYKYLKEYVQDRENVLENNKLTKMEILKYVNSDTAGKGKRARNNWLISFENEILNIQNLIFDEVKKLIPTTNKKNPKGSTLNKVLCVFEDFALQLAMDKHMPHGDVQTPMFDGFHAVPSVSYKSVVQELNALTKDFGITWAAKEFNRSITIKNELAVVKSDNYDEIKQAFEVDHFMAKFPLRFYEKFTDEDGLMVLREYKKEEFGTLCAPWTYEIEDGSIAILKRWISDKDRLCYDKIQFLPPPLTTPQNVFNSFGGFRHYKLQVDPSKNTDFSFLQNHIKHLCGSEKTDELFNYIEQYLANILFTPAILPRVAILIRSVQGTGKNLFFEKLLGAVLSEASWLSSSNIDDFFGKFADTEKVFVSLFDEAQGSDSFSAGNFIKTAIANDKKRVEKKGKDTYQSLNFARYFIFSNGQTPIQIEVGDRRFIAIDCDNSRISNEYVQELKANLEDDNIIAAYVEHLRAIHDPFFDWIEERPLTEYYKSLQSVNISQFELFLTNLLYKKHMPHLEFSGIEFYKKYKEYMEDKSFKPVTQTAFGTEMKKFKGVECKRKSKGNIYYLNAIELIDNFHMDEGTKIEYKTKCGICTMVSDSDDSDSYSDSENYSD